MPPVALNLLDNSKRFLREALSKAILAEREPAEWQFAILSLVQSIELVLKELLRKEHPILIFKQIERPTETVGIKSAVERLRTAAGITFPESDYDTIKIASRFRNQVVHHEYSFDSKEVKLVFAKLFAFLQEVFTERIDESLDTFIEKDLLLEGLKVREYGEQLFARARSVFSQKDFGDEYILTCPSCGWEALNAWDDENRCYVCGHIEDVIICDRCQKAIFHGDHEEQSGRTLCRDCFEYVNDDYWYDISRER